MKRLLVGALVLVLALFVVVPIGGYFIVVRSLKDPKTTELLKSLIQDHVGGEVTLLPIEWRGLAAYTEGVEVRNTADLDRIRIDQLRGEVSLRSLLLDRVWKIENIEAQRLQVDVAREVKKIDAPAKKTVAVIEDIPWWAWWLPGRVSYGPIQLSQVDIRWPWLDNEQATIDSMAVRLVERNDGWDIEGTGGSITLPSFPLLRLVELKGRVRKPYFFITQLRWQNAIGGGEGEVSGELALDKTLESHAKIVARSIPLQNFLKEDWRARFLGELEGTLDLTAGGTKENAPSHWKGIGKLKGIDAVIDALPQLETWAQFSGLNVYRRLRLHRAEADVLLDENGATFQNIKIESRNLVRVEGRVNIKDRLVNGEIEVGLTEEQVKVIPGGRTGIFTREAEGYWWAVPPVRISGTVDAVKEDLSGRVGSALIDDVQKKIQSGAEKILDRMRSWF